MDLLDGIFSAMDKTTPKSTNQLRPSSSKRPFPPRSQKPSTPLSEVQKIEVGESSSSSPFCPPAIFNKRPATSSYSGQPTVKREKEAVTFDSLQLIDVQANQYEVNLDKMSEVIERFHIDIFAVNNKNKMTTVNGEILVHGDLAKQQRRWGLWKIWKLLIERSGHLFSKEIQLEDGVYDCGSSIYFAPGLYIGGDEETIVLERESFEEDEWGAIAKLGKIEIETITVVIVRNKGLGRVYTRGEESLRPENNGELIRFLEALTSQVTNTRNFFQFGNSTFHRSDTPHPDEGNRPEIEGKEIRTGFEKTMKLVSNVNGQPKIVMTLDTRRSPFYKEMPLLDMISIIYTGRKGSMVDEIMRTEGVSRTSRRLNELKGLVVLPKHLPKNRSTSFFIEGFTQDTAIEQTFTNRENKTFTVKDYYLDKYSIVLDYPHYPLVTQKKTNGSVCYPVELLKIERGQRVKQNNISARVQKEMTGGSAFLPANHIKCTRHFLFDYLKIRNNKNLKSFGVSIDQEPIKLTARVLPPPIINFGRNRKFTPRTDIVRPPTIEENMFLKPAKLKDIWIINFDEVLTNQDKGRLCDSISNILSRKDISVSKSSNWEVKNCDEADHERLRKIMLEAKDKGVSLLFAVTREQRPDVHDVLKLFENQIGLQTQQICMRTCGTLMQTSGGKQTIDNVIRKLNVKCGGLNFTFSIPKTTVRQDEDRIKRMFFNNTLFIGFELAHAGARMLFDRQNGITCGEPSVVGYSYTCGDQCDLGGNYYLQKPREHGLMYLPKFFDLIISNYMSALKKLPEKVVIYRSGVGEGDFEKIQEEVNQMKSVFESGGFKGKAVPQFLMIVVSKTSHTRLYPQDLDINSKAKPLQQNVPSGTCLTGGITSYNREEFYLVSQSAAIGTVRPTRYTIITNEPKWSLNEVSNLTYFMAFGHQVSYQPPGVPNVLYAAENLAKRGRNNFKTYQRVERLGNDRRHSPPAEEVPIVKEEDEQYKVMMDELSARLSTCTIKCKNFWA